MQKFFCFALKFLFGTSDIVGVRTKHLSGRGSERLSCKAETQILGEFAAKTNNPESK